ncbi:DUF1134 domain-containing protein [Hyphomicrobium sp. 99]|uniref:DUF1134 domain-containing protein n=1 Tax=Hyphomicrobium sp. 99 TaxID=1163419 RepID=UPI0005F7F995|nr:DUF1134 domain-containing protein [Hyphomicrobium sp. 99]
MRRRGFDRTTRIKGAAYASIFSLAACFFVGGSTADAQDDAYRPPADTYTGQSGVDSYRTAPPPPPDNNYAPPPRNSAGGDPYGPYNGPRDQGGDPGGYGAPYAPPPESAGRGYEPGPPERDTYSEDEIIRAGNHFFGKVSGGLASAVEWAFQKAGRPNGYILGEDAAGAFVAGLAYGEGTLYTKDAGSFRVYWQGPSVGYDFGADGSKVMTLVYNLRDPNDIFDRFGGVEGSAYLVGGVSVQFQKSGHVSLAPIRAGVGLRLGANVGYLKYTRSPTWNPF